MSGWNGSGQRGNSTPIKSKVTAKKPSPIRGIVAGAVVVVLAVVAYFAFFSGDEKEPEKVEKERGRIKEVTPAAASAYKEVSCKDDFETKRKANLAKLRSLPPEERFEYFVSQIQQKPLDLEPSTNQPFKTVTEDMMRWVFTTQVGDQPPPMPRVPLREQVHMAEILIASNPVIEGDDERTKADKEIVSAAKKELIDYIRNGGDVYEFFDYYHDQLDRAHSEWKDCQQSVFKAVREDPDIAIEYLDEVNKRLASKGIKPVKLPPKVYERLGISN